MEKSGRHLKWKHFTSYSSEGDNFVLGMMQIEKRWENARELFTTFINSIGFTAWHIHDGWVTHNYQNGNILHNEDIEVVWIKSHAGYSHVWRCPEVGEKMIIVSNSPGGEVEETNPFPLYCYQVIDKNKRWSGGNDIVKLKRIEIKQAIFNPEENRYQLYTKERRSIFSFLKRKIKSKQ